MSITLEVGGDVYTGFVEATVTQSLIDLANTFSFEATAADGVPLPFKGQEACKVFVDGKKKLTGSIELINIEGDGGSHRIVLTGRDKCGDLLDTMLGPMQDIQGTLSLKRICEIVIAHVGLSIKVIDNANPKLFEELVDMGSPDPGQYAFEYLEPLARKRQVLLTSNEDGDLVITKADQVESKGAYIHHRVGDPELKNNVLDYSFSRDFTGRFNVYRTVGSMSAPAAAIETEQLTRIGLSAEFMASQLTLTRDQAIRVGRQFILVDESAIPTGDSGERARWERDIRKARGDAYGVTVHGYSHQGGEHWKTNRLVTVLSEYIGVSDKMLVDSVSFNQSPGSSTTITLIDKDAYTLSLLEPVEESLGVFG